uniref:CSON000833 protein n=1 Tax=Culicoides sonorensis TaxID=179676 RepID=A0A336KVH1_CULSO
MEENVDKANAVKPLDEVEQQLQEMFNGVEEKVEVEKQPEDAEKPKKETPIKNQNNNKKISKKKIKRKKENQISKPTPVEVTTIPSLTKFKGPYIQVRQNLVTVVNFPKNDDEVEKLQSKQKYMSHKNEKRKIRGMHASTLSIKYDDQTTDHTWVCIFCKKGPHKDRLGDFILSEYWNLKAI